MLQPRTQQLQNLGVGGYRGSCFPQWMSGLSLKYLKRLLLVDCKSCSYLNKESYDAGRTAGGFIALEYLLLEGMENMISWSKEDGENMFPCLSKLEIIKCPNLLCLPCLPSLKDLYILGECSQELLSSIHKSRSLENMWLEHNEELTCFPDGMLTNLTSLKKLVIRGHSKLEVLPTEITNLSALRVLHISDCESLKSLTNEVLQGLHSLVILELVRCPKFILSAGFRYLTCLEELAIGNFSEVEEGLHEALQHMTSLQSLSLSELPNLTSLPDCFGNLGSLHSLQISACPNLTCLPTTIQCLNALKVLNICGCPELATRCQKETGEDWTKIAHVKYLHISNDDKLYCYALAGIRDVLHEGLF